ncbi:MAG: phosphotransferase [Legionellaceae bacterium]|nr:phosphotransferase [Legionellaceae bacterium]
MQNRENALFHWVCQQLGDSATTLVPLHGDASFRRYYRCHHQQHSYIVMDAPPDKEAMAPFIQTAALLRQCAVHVPRIYSANQALGFALLEDFGDSLMGQHLHGQAADICYRRAMDQLLLLQNCPAEAYATLPAFDRPFMLMEMQLMPQWFLAAYLRKQLTTATKTMLSDTFNDIAQQIGNQKRSLIHRDFHSRNLMMMGEPTDGQLGVIDFQDAMIGPHSYDLVSLLKDCYIEWERPQQLQWLQYYFQQSPLAKQSTFSQLTADYDLCGLQRHLKVLGIFSRLYLRDGKAGFLKDLPLTLKYIRHCLQLNGWYPELLDLLEGVELP